MSTITTATTPKFIPLSQIGWLRERNYRVDYGNLKGLRDSMIVTPTGWLPNKPCDAHPLKGELTELVDAMNQEWGVLKDKVANPNSKASSIVIPVPSALGDDKVSLDGTMEMTSIEDHEWNVAKLAAFEHMHVHEGKIIKPKYSGISGNRRSVALIDAVAIMLHHEMDISDWGVHVIVPVKGSYTPEERMLVQLHENKDDDRKEPTIEEELTQALELVERYGKNQAAVRQVFKASRGVQLYFMACQSIYARANGWDGELDILNQIVRDARTFNELSADERKKFKPRWSIKQFSQKAWQGADDGTNMGPRLESDYFYEAKKARAERDNKLTADNKQFARPTEQEFAKWAEKVNTVGAVRKCMTAKQIGGVSQSMNKIVAATCDAILNSESDGIAKLSDLSEATNFVFSASESKYHLLVKLFEQAGQFKEQEQVVLFAELLERAEQTVKQAVPAAAE